MGSSDLTLSSTDTSVATRIGNQRLLTAARIVWIVVASATVLWFAANFVTSVNLRLTPCIEAPCSRFQPTPEILEPFNQAGISLTLRALYLPVGELLTLLVYVIVGLVIFVRRSNDWMALVCSLALVTFGAAFGVVVESIPTIQPAWDWITVALYLVVSLLLFTFLYLFPNGRFAPRWAVWLFGLSLLCETTIRIFARYSNLNRDAFLVTLGLAAVAIVGQIYRYRYVSTPSQRQQAKWVLIGVGITTLGQAFTLLPPLLVNPLLTPTQTAIYYFVRLTLIYATTIAAPLAIGFSVLRYRLWEVDLVINRSLVYGGLAASLGISFVAGFFMLQALLGAILGGEQSTTAAVIATAIIVGLYNPVRRRMQHLVDRRFYHLRMDLDQLQEQREALAVKARAEGVLTGRTLGVYKVGALLGKGGMGEVYKGRHTSLQRDIAIKILPRELASEEFRARFEREARIVAALRHPNIVSMFDFGLIEDTYFMVMEYIQGQELGDYLKANGRLSLDETRLLLYDIAAALDYAHAEGLVHRDIKPSNIMLERVTDAGGRGELAGRPYRAVLMDFGIAKMAGGITGLTHTGMMGTLDYAAPEQIMDARQVDKRADIYALGITLFQMLTGELPFRGSVGQIVFAHLQQPAPNPCDFVPTLPSSVGHVVLKALEKKSQDRYQNAGELAAALG